VTCLLLFFGKLESWQGLTHSRKLKIFWLKIHNSVVTRAILFGSNMHQIVQRLGLCPRPDPNYGSSQRSTDPLAGKSGEGKEGNRREEEGGEGKGGEVASSLNLSQRWCDKHVRAVWLVDGQTLSLATACSLSLPVQCAYADKLNCPKRNVFHGRTEQWRSALGYLMVLQH